MRWPRAVRTRVEERRGHISQQQYRPGLESVNLFRRAVEGSVLARRTIGPPAIQPGGRIRSGRREAAAVRGGWYNPRFVSGCWTDKAAAGGFVLVLERWRGLAKLATVLVAPVMFSPPGLAATQTRPAAGAGLQVENAVFSHGEISGGPGSVVLQMEKRKADDPPDVVRLRAVLEGPLRGDHGDDLFALNAVLTYPSDQLAFVPRSLVKGDLLGRDGRDFLLTGGVSAGSPVSRLTIGASRIGAVSGVKAPAGRWTLFSLAFKVLKPGKSEIGWDEATFIDSHVRAIHLARFIGGTLQVSGGTDLDLTQED
ncbi:MAG: hypothetical protein ACE5ID_04635 [Acidobacteriota bacterium]